MIQIIALWVRGGACRDRDSMPRGCEAGRPPGFPRKLSATAVISP